MLMKINDEVIIQTNDHYHQKVGTLKVIKNLSLSRPYGVKLKNSQEERLIWLKLEEFQKKPF